MNRMLTAVAVWSVVLIVVGPARRAPGQEAPPASAPVETILYTFETDADLQAWTDAEQLDPKTQKPKEPAAKLELTPDGATSGQKAMKITFPGGHFPTITTAAVPDVNWKGFKSVKLDVRAGRACVVGFRIRSEKGVMDKAEFLQPGKNTIVSLLAPAYLKVPPPAGGKVLGFDIFMYDPHPNESITIDNIRLSQDKPDLPDYRFMVKPNSKRILFKVLGTDLTVEGVAGLADKLKDQWKEQESRSLGQIEDEFKAQFEDLKKANPKAVLVVLRDGEKGYDLKDPEKVYDGWKDAYLNAHSPDGELDGHAAKTGKMPYSEVFMRHRSRIMQVDLSSIPAGSQILAARFILTRASAVPASQLATRPYADTIAKPNMWVAEPCNRDWDEAEVNAFQYAKDKFWKAYSGTWYGEDPDFEQLFVACGPAQGNVSWWDFTNAVKYWTDGQHANHGFFWHGDSQDYWAGASPTREAKDVKLRPALFVAYVPGQ